MYLYHGLHIEKIDLLLANSRQHNGNKEKAVYLTSDY